MKKTFIIISSLILSCAQTAIASQAENPDTLLHTEKPSRVIIRESAKGTFIEVQNLDSAAVTSFTVDYPSESKVSTTQKRKPYSFIELPGLNYAGSRHKSRWFASIDGLCVGLTDAMNQTGGGGLQWSKSFEISWLSCLNVNYEFSRSRISLGLGFDWRNYKTTLDGKWLVPSGSGGLEWGEAPEGATARCSRLKVFSLQLPLLYSWRIPKSELALKLGPIPCFNTYASLKGVYDDAAGNRHEYFTTDINKRPFTLDFFGSLTYHKAIGIYVRWSPMKVLRDPSPINLNPFTIGIGFLI